MLEEFHYQIPWRTGSAHPGRHASHHSGGEHEFHGHAPLYSRPEAHNIDVHASLLDPFQQYVVRTFRQRGVINVVVIADLSASMSFNNKMATLSRFTELVAFSAYRSGDHFSFMGCGEQLLTDFYLPPRWYKGGADELTGKLRSFKPNARTCESLSSISESCPRHRSLIFLVSDFHFPIEETAAIMDSLLKHDVVPVLLWHPEEYESLPEWGLIRLVDPETGKIRSFFMRPRLKQRITAAFAQKQENLTQLFLRYGRQPLMINESFTADDLTRYFYEQ